MLEQCSTHLNYCSYGKGFANVLNMSIVNQVPDVTKELLISAKVIEIKGNKFFRILP